MIFNKVYTAKRFFINEHEKYSNRFITIKFREIVTADTELCDRRATQSVFNVSKQNIIEIHNEQHCKLKKNEQYIYLDEISMDLKECSLDSFEYCGIDIIDKFKTNSWVTNYDISYDLKPYNYTKYGLLKDISAVKLWLSRRNLEINTNELRQKQFFLVAVWRKT